MRRLVALLGCLTLMLLVSPASATPVFKKQWEDKFIKDNPEASDEFKAAVKKYKCNICHVNKKNKKKPEGKNEYGKALSNYLKAKDFKTAYVNKNPAEAKEKILAAFAKANEMESKDGKTFGEKIQGGEVPATDSGVK